MALEIPIPKKESLTVPSRFVESVLPSGYKISEDKDKARAQIRALCGNSKECEYVKKFDHLIKHGADTKDAVLYVMTERKASKIR